MAIYLDCNATTPIDPEVQRVVLHYMSEEFGNAGSRTHDFGARAKKATNVAREQVASLIQAQPEEVVFTSGATESNNIAILGLEGFAKATGKTHIISTTIEHKAVLEPLEVLAGRGFDIDLISCDSTGVVNSEEVRSLLRENTLLVSVMHVNNETGVIQPIDEIAHILTGHNAYFHVDAAQGFGKDLERLGNDRIDLVSISGHKLYAPKGIGALVCRRRDFDRPPLEPLMFGGGQERGLRPGTLPVALIAGLGQAAEEARNNHSARIAACCKYRETMMEGLMLISPTFNGDQSKTLPHTVNVSFPRVDSEALMVALKDHISISNGSACTSSSYTPSHVLKAMGLPEEQIKSAVRISWCHMTEAPDWKRIATLIKTVAC